MTMSQWNWKQCALPVLLLLALGANRLFTSPPAPTAYDSDPLSFSALRAFDHVEKIATVPHAVGTPENKIVRDYLVDHLKAAGLEVEVQHTQIIDSYRSGGPDFYAGIPASARFVATVNNIVARLKGTKPGGKALMLMSHYDSVYYGPGAGDDASGTSTLMETLRAVQAGEPLENDLILLITDSEEPGLFGAEAFFDQHRWAADTGMILNFEARGSRGPVTMFQTAELNDKAIAAFAKAVDKPVANSLAVTIYRKMPNDTDLSISLKAGIPGLNFAFSDGYYDYHTEGDNKENLSKATLQHMGEQALAMTRTLGNMALPLEDTTEVVFFDILSLAFFSYPLWGSWLAAALAVGLFAAFVVGIRRREGLSFTGTARALLSALLMLVFAVLLMDLLFLMLGGRSGDLVEGRRLFALDSYQLAGFALLGFALFVGWLEMTAHGLQEKTGKIWIAGSALFVVSLYFYETSWKVAAVATILAVTGYFLLRSPIKAADRRVGSTALYLIAALGAQWAAPVGSYLLVWPLVLVLGMQIILARRAMGENFGLALIAASGFLGAVWLIYFTETGYSALGLALPAVIAVPIGLLILLLAPAMFDKSRSSHMHMVVASAALGLGFLAYVATASGFDARHRQPTEVFYMIDAKGDGQNHYASRIRNFDPWALSLMGKAEGSVPENDLITGRRGTRGVSLNPAPPSTVLPLTVENNITSTGSSFTLKPGYRGDVVAAILTASKPFGTILVNGEALDTRTAEAERLVLYYFAVPQGGLKIYITEGGSIDVQATEVSSTWPKDIAGLIPAKPATIMVAPYRLSDSTLSTIKFSLPAQSQSPAAAGSEQTPSPIEDTAESAGQ